MEVSERRAAIMQILYRQRFETTNNLMARFGVSKRTIRRDIEELSKTEPIYTKSGRYGGGIYVIDGYYGFETHLKKSEIELIHKFYHSAQSNQQCQLTLNELATLKGISEKFPLKKGGETNETARAGSF